jgi:hypothetical protein
MLHWISMFAAGAMAALSIFFVFRPHHPLSGIGQPDLRGQFLQRRKASLNNNSSFPHPPKPKEKPAGLKRRA